MATEDRKPAMTTDPDGIECRDETIRLLETAVLEAAISDRLDENGSPMSWQEIARAAETKLAELEQERFRPRYRALTDDEKALHDAIKGKASELEVLFDQVKPGRYRSLGLTALEEAVMWCVKELTS